jgi:hypothetical protein
MSDEMKRPDAGENSPAEHERAAGRAAARLDRINRYADAALDKADDLEANLGLITAGLLETALAQQRLLDCATERFTDSPKGLELQHRALEDYLRVIKQIERNFQLELRSRESHSET